MKKGYSIATILLMISISMILWLSGESQMTEAFTLVDIAPKDYQYDEPDDLSKNGAEAALLQAEIDLKEMKERGFAIIYAQDALQEAQQLFDEGNYSQVFKLTQLINYVKKEKIEFIDRIKLLEIKKQALRDKGVTKTSAVNDLMQQAMNAFTLEQLEEANLLLDKANEELTQANKEYNRLQTLRLLGKNFFLKYWWQIIVLLVLLGLAVKPTIKIIRVKLLRSKHSRLQLELDKTKDLIRNLQKECFVERTIPVNTYKERAAKYEERITEVKRTLPVVEAELKNLQEQGWFRKKWQSRFKRDNAPSSASTKNRRPIRKKR